MGEFMKGSLWGLEEAVAGLLFLSVFSVFLFSYASSGKYITQYLNSANRSLSEAVSVQSAIGDGIGPGLIFNSTGYAFGIAVENQPVDHGSIYRLVIAGNDTYYVGG
jgi:hypothetical protein